MGRAWHRRLWAGCESAGRVDSQLPGRAVMISGCSVATAGVIIGLAVLRRRTDRRHRSSTSTSQRRPARAPEPRRRHDHDRRHGRHRHPARRTGSRAPGPWATGASWATASTRSSSARAPRPSAGRRASRASLTIEGTTVTEATFEVDMTTFESDESRRDGQFEGRIMEVDRVPHRHLRAHRTDRAGRGAGRRSTGQVEATGDLTLHGVTREVTIAARRPAGRHPPSPSTGA